MYNVIIVGLLMALIVATPVFEILTIGVNGILLAINVTLDTLFNKLVNNERES